MVAGMTASYPASYYAATAHPAPERPALAGEIDAEVCIVGAGFTGLSAALELAERGHEVVVLEAAKVGWGASGRNGGQIVNGLNAGPRDDRAALRRGRRPTSSPRVVQEGGRIIRERVARYGIACDLKDGNLFAAFTAQADARARGEAGALAAARARQLRDARPRRACGGTWRATSISAGCSTARGGHLHPLNLALGQAAALEGLGGVIHEASPVIADRGRRAGGRWCGRRAGAVRPEALILAGNAYLGRRGAGARQPGHAVLDADHRDRAARASAGAALLPTDVCVEDVRYVLDYYRLSADGRLLFGGGTVYGGTDPADIRAKLVPNLERVFPAAQGRARRLRLVGQLRDLVQPGAAARAARAAQLLRAGLQRARGGRQPPVRADPRARRCDGDPSRFDVFARVPWIPFPGRPALRRALFRSRLVVVWLARPPRRVNRSRKEAADEPIA